MNNLNEALKKPIQQSQIYMVFVEYEYVSELIQYLIDHLTKYQHNTIRQKLFYFFKIFVKVKQKLALLNHTHTVFCVCSHLVFSSSPVTKEKRKNDA